MYTESERGMLVHQKPYIEKKLQLLPKISPKNDQLLQEHDLKTYGQAIGKLIWILPTNVETCFEITFLSRFRNSASAGLYKRLNQLIYRKINIHLIEFYHQKTQWRLDDDKILLFLV